MDDRFERIGREHSRLCAQCGKCLEKDYILLDAEGSLAFCYPEDNGIAICVVLYVAENGETVILTKDKCL